MIRHRPEGARSVVEACRAIWGEQWQGEAARALRLAPRTIQRIAQANAHAQAYPIAPGVYADLAKLARLRGLDAQAGALDAFALVIGDRPLTHDHPTIDHPPGGGPRAAGGGGTPWTVPAEKPD